MDPYGPEPGPRNAPSGRVGFLLVSLYSWTCITIGVTLARFVFAYIHKIRFECDDLMALAGTFFYTGATVACHYAVEGGLGKRFVEVKPGEAAQFFKAAYVAQLLQIIAMSFGKLSSAFLLGRVAPQSWRERSILFGSVGFWAVYSIFAFAFQCGLPRPWEHNPEKCGHGRLLISIIILNMASDVVLIAWIFPILHPLHMDKARRRSVGILFGSRVVVVLVAGVQIWVAVKYGRSKDPTWDGFAMALSTHGVTSLSLIIASIPRIKRFIGSRGLNTLRIRGTEIPLPNRPRARSEDGSLKLIPCSLSKVTTTVSSEGSKKTDKTKTLHDGQKFGSTGSKQGDQNSGSSLFEHHGGVMLQKEVTVEVENKSSPVPKYELPEFRRVQG